MTDEYSQGQEAYQHWDISNPYPAQSLQGIEWSKGWDASWVMELEAKRCKRSQIR